MSDRHFTETRAWTLIAEVLGADWAETGQKQEKTEDEKTHA